MDLSLAPKEEQQIGMQEFLKTKSVDTAEAYFERESDDNMPIVLRVFEAPTICLGVTSISEGFVFTSKRILEEFHKTLPSMRRGMTPYT